MLWRILILGPIVWILGLALLLLVLGAFVVLPIYAILAFYTGDWLFASVALAGWTVVLRFRGPLLRWTLEGIEYGSI